MDFINKQFEAGSITREEALKIKEDQRALFATSSIDKYSDIMDAKNKKDVTDMHRETEFNTALMKKISTEVVEISVTDSARGHIEENFEYRKLTNKEKKARQKELNNLKKDNRELTIESVNIATDHRNLYESKCKSLNDFSKKNEIEFRGENEVIALLLCEGSKEKDSQRLYDYFRGGETARKAVLDEYVDKLLDIKVDSRMLNESYIISHFALTGDICEKFKYLDVLMNQNRDYLEGLSDDKREILDIMRETVRALDEFRSEVCNSYGVYSEKGVYIPNFDERTKQEHKTAIKDARERGIAALDAMQLNKARMLAKQANGLRQLDAATFVARHDYNNPYIDTAGCNIKRKLDRLKSNRETSINDEIKAKAQATGIDVRIFMAYAYGYETDAEGYVKSGTDAWQRSRDLSFANTYLEGDEINRAFLFDNIINEAKSIRDRFADINERDIVANPQTYAIIAERMAVLDNIVKGNENALYLEDMDSYKREELLKDVLPSAQYIYSYISATFKKHGYNLETGTYLTKEESENIQSASALEMKIAMAKYSLSLKDTHERELKENTLNKTRAFSSRLDEIKGQYYKLINMELDPMALENDEFVTLVSEGFAKKLDDSYWAEEFLLNEKWSEKLIYAELLKKTISPEFIDSLIECGKADVAFGMMSGMMITNNDLMKLVEAGFLKAKKHDKYKKEFMNFLYENVIGSLMYAKIAKDAREEFIRLRMDSSNLNSSDDELRKMAEKNTDYNNKINVWLELNRELKGYGEGPRSEHAIRFRQSLD